MPESTTASSRAAAETAAADTAAVPADTVAAPADTVAAPADELTVDELAAEAGIPVRRVRFYAGKRLLPPPRLAGRVGLYGPTHLARLRLVSELQDAGYTLAAIEDFLAGIPEDADADQVELFGTLLAPTNAGQELRLSPQELSRRTGVELDDDVLRTLEDARLLQRCEDGTVALTQAQLDFALRLLELDAPLDALVEAGRIVEHHVSALAADLQRVFRTRISAAFDDPEDADRDRLRALAAALRPLTIQAMVSSYQAALDREVRGQAPAD